MDDYDNSGCGCGCIIIILIIIFISLCTRVKNLEETVGNITKTEISY